MSSSRFTISLLCVPFKYLPFPVSFIPRTTYVVSGFCAKEHIAVFLVSDKNKIDPATIFYSFDEAKEAYKKLTNKDFVEKETISTQMKTNKGFLKYSSMSHEFDVIYTKDYFNDDKNAEDNHKSKIIEAIISMRDTLLNDLDNEVTNEFEIFIKKEEVDELNKNLTENKENLLAKVKKLRNI